MIELNKPYTTQELAEACGMSYGCFRNNRAREEKHLSRFYDYTTTYHGRSIIYIFLEQRAEYIPYRVYNNVERTKLLRESIQEVIADDSRQTGSNIARIIIINDEIQALNLELSTLTNYTRQTLRDLVEEGYYVKEDYQWCYLDRQTNTYTLMTPDQIQKLKTYFHSQETEDTIENIYAEYREGTYTHSEAESKIGKLKLSGFIAGIQRYADEHGYRPMKVPVYSRVAF